MNSKNSNRPPRWAERFLEFYCRRSLLEDLQGDLNEYFERNQKALGVKRARLIYVIDVLKFFRTYTIRKPEFINVLIHYIMIGSYIKTSGRTIVRNKLFSAINIIGLAISMSVGLLMIVFLSDLLSYDRMHANRDRIYRVINDYQWLQNKPDKMATTSVKAFKRLQNDISGIEDMVLLRRNFSGDGKAGDNIVPLSGVYSTEDFFKVFSFQLVSGDSRTALKQPYSIVLTETSAKKIFGNAEALGKTINIKGQRDTADYTVTGVMKDIPKFSHIRFESLVSFSSYEAKAAATPNFLKWDNMWMNYIYLSLPEGSDPKDIQAKLDRICKEENPGVENTTVTMKLQPLMDIALGEDLSNQIGPHMIVGVVWVVAGLSFIVILSACFNYTNLSIARSLRRSREVGIRKVIGAQKGHVVGQFITEAILISLFALALSFVLFLFLKGEFLSIAPDLSEIVSMDLSPRVVAAFVIFAVVVGVCAGLLPAFFYSKINALQVLKTTSSMRVFKNVSMRKVLIVVQYSFSLIFITATIIGYKQYKHFLSFDLGFNTANVVNIELKGNNPDLFEKALKEFPEVQAISRSQMITSVGDYWGTQVKYIDPMDSSGVNFNSVDENYFPLHGHKFVAGKNFTAKGEGSEESEVIINEMLMKRFKIGNDDPNKALGEIIQVDRKPLQIVGVLKDFHYGKADVGVKPVLFRYTNKEADYLNVKINSSDWPSTFVRMESAWKKIDPVHPLEATFYDDQIERAYNEFSAMIKVMGFLAFLAISIASLGLLGMVVFITETRIKEIGIRKVLGATERNLIYILSRGFLLLLAIAAFIALPLTYIFFDQVILTNMANHAPIGIREMIISVAVVMGIALLMIGMQTLKVARSNPAQVLKTE
jgi:putative ABC transport system permease protein